MSNEECHHLGDREEQRRREANIRAVLDEVRHNLAMWLVAEKTEPDEVVDLWCERAYDPLRDMCCHDLALAVVHLLVHEGEHERIAENTFEFLRSVTT